MLRAAILLVLLWPLPAMAMNWEGHDDWMAGFAPALTLEEHVPQARPLPSRDCPVSPEKAAENPYEQIPLPQHKCPASSKEAAPRN